MLRVLRAAARTSRTSFSFSATRKLSAAGILPTTKAAAERASYAHLLPGDSFLFLRTFSSSSSSQQRHDDHSPIDSELSSSLIPEIKPDIAPQLSSSVIPEAHDDDDTQQLTDESKYEAQPASASANTDVEDVGLAPQVSSSVIPEAHDDVDDDDDANEILTTQQLTDDSKYEARSASASANTDVGEVDLNTKGEAEFDEDLELHENATQLKNDTESPMSAGQENEARSASDSAYTEDDSAEYGKDSTSDFVAESEEDCAIDMTKVPEDLKEMMEDSYVCESAEEDFPSEGPIELLTLDEVKQVLEEVRARDVKIFPVHDRCEWTDLMVVATGISDRHVRGIADALVFKIKKKGIVESPLYPTIEGQFGGKWLVVDCGNLVIHVLDEESRAYYSLEELWTGDVTPSTADEDFETMLNQAGLKDVVP